MERVSSFKFLVVYTRIFKLILKLCMNAPLMQTSSCIYCSSLKIKYPPADLYCILTWILKTGSVLLCMYGSPKVLLIKDIDGKSVGALSGTVAIQRL